jgi:hypothetical protein
VDKILLILKRLKYKLRGMENISSRDLYLLFYGLKEDISTATGNSKVDSPIVVALNSFNGFLYSSYLIRRLLFKIVDNIVNGRPIPIKLGQFK